MGIAISDVLSILNRPKPTAAGGGNGTAQSGDTKQLLLDMENIYGSEPTNWYQAKPYGFIMNTRDNKQFVFFLPISPSNLNISTSFATNVIPTLYGTVEEHSDVRYFDISIEGTTGMAPRYILPSQISKGGDVGAADKARSQGRGRVSIVPAASLGGFASQTMAIFNQIAGKAADLVNGSPKPLAGFAADKSGYSAFHNFYRFLLRHKKDASGADGNTGTRKQHPLTFFNYKDNNQYDVVIKNFTLRKSVENPMLYSYSIQMRAYNMRSVNSNGQADEDMKQRLVDMGLDGVDGSSVLGDIKSIVGDAKSIVTSAVQGLAGFGR